MHSTQPFVLLHYQDLGTSFDSKLRQSRETNPDTHHLIVTKDPLGSDVLMRLFDLGAAAILPEQLNGDGADNALLEIFAGDGSLVNRVREKLGELKVKQ